MHRGQPVRHDESRAVFHEGVDGALHKPLGFGVQGRRRFVEDENGGVAEQCAGDGNALALSAREHHPALADDRGKAIGHFLDEFQGLRRLRSLCHFVARCAGKAVGDIVEYRFVKKYCLLGYDAEQAAKANQIELPGVYTVQGDRPARNIVEPRKQVEDRCLATSAGAHQRHNFAFRNGKAHVVDHFVAASWIGEANAGEPDVAFELRRNAGRNGRQLFRRRVEYCEYPIRRGEARLYCVIHLRERFERLKHDEEKREKPQEILGGENLSHKNVPAAEPEQPGNHANAQRLGKRARQAR